MNLIDEIIRDVSELEPSPAADESHDSMLVTGSELKAILEKRLAVIGPVLDDGAIMAAIRECFPWKDEGQILGLLTYEKSMPMFPQATYDVPGYRAEKFVRAIEARVIAALTQPGTAQ